MRKLILPIMICSCLSGCGLLNPVSQPEIHRYQISIIDANSGTSCNNANSKMGILQVEPIHSVPPYDSKKMFYSNADYELSSYAYHQWAADPGQMLTQAIVENLLQSCIFNNVVGTGVMTRAEYRFSASLFQLNQKIIGDKSTVNLSILVQLINNESNQVTRSKTFVESVDVKASPDGYVEGVNQATQKFLDDLRAWIVIKS